MSSQLSKTQCILYMRLAEQSTTPRRTAHTAQHSTALHRTTPSRGAAAAAAVEQKCVHMGLCICFASLSIFAKVSETMFIVSTGYSRRQDRNREEAIVEDEEKKCGQSNGVNRVKEEWPCVNDAGRATHLLRPERLFWNRRRRLALCRPFLFRAGGE